jgi:hypothetical protein
MGVAVSITGCRLKSRLSRNFFYRQPGRQASTACLHPHTETAELWMQFSPQPCSFMNWRKDLLDLDSSLTTCVVSKWPYRDHEAAPEDTIHKRGGGVCGSLLA